MLAKSVVKNKPDITLFDHTLAVRKGVRTILDTTLQDQLDFLGLPHDLRERFYRIAEIAAILHDLGKAGSHYQRFVKDPNPTKNPQSIRHEWVSVLIAENPEFKNWLISLFPDENDWYLAMFAAAGHHRKPMPIECRPNNLDTLTVPLGDVNVQKTLNLLEIDNSPTHTITFNTSANAVENIIFVLRNLGFHKITRKFNKIPNIKSFLALIKTTLIVGDIIGSIAEFHTSPIYKTIRDSLNDKPDVNFYNSLIEFQESKIIKKNPEYQPHDFQLSCGNSRGPITLITAGCGSGKTLAAFYWSRKHAVNRRMFFCYPTTGTASQGFEKNFDYDLVNKRLIELAHGHSKADLAGMKLDNSVFLFTEEDEKEDRLRKEEDIRFSIGLLTAKAVCCTVDTVLGVLANQRRAVYSFPATAQGAFIFDEIHSYDERLWSALILFLEYTRVPCLLMTGSLQENRLEDLNTVLSKRNLELEIISGPIEQEEKPRYQKLEMEDPYELAMRTSLEGKKILWISNTVNTAIATYENIYSFCRDNSIQCVCLHSNFRRKDRLRNHELINQAFANDKPAIIITTQIAEMSLDLSADILITDLAPIDAMIQRLGRLNRFLDRGIGKFLVLPPLNALPYKQEELDQSQQWLDKLPVNEINQRMLITTWKDFEQEKIDLQKDFPWLFETYNNNVGELREIDPKLQVLIEDPQGNYSKELSFPMSPPPKELGDWTVWDRFGYCVIAPARKISYNTERGGKWK